MGQGASNVIYPSLVSKRADSDKDRLCAFARFAARNVSHADLTRQFAASVYVYAVCLRQLGGEAADVGSGGPIITALSIFNAYNRGSTVSLVRGGTHLSCSTSGYES